MRFSDLLEREAERSGALVALERALADDGACIAYVGAAGVGKTSLLQAAGDEARAHGARVLSARGVERERELPFGLAGQLFTPALVCAVGIERERLLGGDARLADALVGLGPASAMPPSPAAARHGLYWLCANLCERGPLVLAVDDVHWSDRESLAFLAHLVHRLDGLPLLIAVSARTTEPTARCTLLDELLDEEVVRVWAPRPLSETSTAAIARTFLGTRTSDELCRACHAATGGNPSLLSELLAALQRSGVDPACADLDAIEQVGALSSARSALVRLARLRPQALAVARAVAIFPGGAEFRHLVALTGSDAPATADAADELVEMEILARGRPISFLHPLMHAAVYHEVPEALRGLLHLSAAAVLREEGADPAAVAAHVLATEPGIDPRAFSDLLAAARAALARDAPDASILHLDRALLEPLWPSAAAEARHLRGLAGMAAGRADAVDDLRAAASASSIDDPQRLRDLARALAFNSQPAAAAATIERARAACSRADERLSAHCAIDRTWILWSHHETASEYVAEMQALQVADPPATLREHAMAAMKAQWEAYQATDSALAVELARRGLRDGCLVAEGFDALPAVAFGAVALMLGDRPREALAAMDAALDVQRSDGALMALTYGHVVAALVRIYGGDLAGAESELQLALKLARSGGAGEQAVPAILPLLAVVELERTGLAGAEELLDALEVPPTWIGVHVLAARGHVHLAAGRHAAARDDLTAMLRLCEARGQRNPLYATAWRGDLALATAAMGDRDRAAEQAQEDLRVARRFGAPGVVGTALRTAGLVAGGPSGVVLLDEAATVLAGSSARFLYAEALTDLGAALRRANQRLSARTPLRLAIDLAQRCGSRRLASRAIEEQRAAGGRPRRTFVSGVQALTPSERRVARMAASGLTNREIAQELYLTVKTVEMHIGNALAKLGVSSRRHFATVLAAGDDQVPAPLDA